MSFLGSMFESTYKEFAEAMSVNEHIVVAKLDGLLNESPLPEFQWAG